MKPGDMVWMGTGGALYSPSGKWLATTNKRLCDTTTRGAVPGEVLTSFTHVRLLLHPV